jgi:anti-sigma factor ChrR (cupin superfamily)
MEATIPATHITREQLLKYRNRALAPQELIGVDAHLAQCQDCRDELTALASVSVSMISAVREALDEHLSYEQMDAWVENELDSTERELVLAHIEVCPPCARQLRAYESYAPAMSASVIAPAQPILSFGEKLKAWLRLPRIAIIAAAVAVVVIAVQREDSSRSLTNAQLDALPDSVRSSAKDVINAGSAVRPESLAGLAPNADPSLLYPVSEVVEERQPILLWKPFGSSYSIELLDSAGREVAHSGAVNTTHWLVPMQLRRGEEYTWQIQDNGETRRASFRVLNDSSEAKLDQVRASGAGSLAMGAVAEQMGLLSMAQEEFGRLEKEQPRSKDAAKLLDRVNELRGR